MTKKILVYFTIIISISLLRNSASAQQNNITVSGCNDTIATNYDSTATIDDGSCCYDSLSSINQIGLNIVNHTFTINDNMGRAVTISDDGNRIAMSSPYHDGSAGYESGIVRVYQRSVSNQWSFIGSIEGNSSCLQTGYSIAFSDSGNTIVVGAPRINCGLPGTVSVWDFDENSSSWTQRGSYINDNNSLYLSGNYFGKSVEISSDGNSIVVGIPGYDISGSSNIGAVNIYDWDVNNQQWVLRGSSIIGESFYDLSGNTVSISNDGNTVAIGAPENDGPSSYFLYDVGHVRIYDWNGTSWIQRGNDIDGEDQGDESSFSLSISGDGNYIAVGAPENSESISLYNQGSVRVYNWDGNNWNLMGSEINGESINIKLGYSLDINDDGSRLVIGAPEGYSGGHTKIYDWNGSTWENSRPKLLGTNGKFGYQTCINSDGSIVAITDPYSTYGYGEGVVFSVNNLCIVGCLDSLACNYNPLATIDDGSCLYNTASSTTMTACNSYNWNGTTYTSSGVYTDTLTNSVGCDSIATLNLTINNSTSSTTIVDTCVTYDSTATFRYVRIFNDRSFMPTLMFGEFELYVAGVNVCRDTSHGYANLYMSAQQGSNTDSHKSNGVNGGTYYGPKTNAAPTNYWMIEFNNSYSLSEVQSAVLKTWTRYNWVSHRQALRGLQIQFLDQNLNQINEKIVVPSTQSSHYTVTQFNYKSGYTWNGTVYDSSAVYKDTLTNSVGCDSIVTLNLTINNNSTSTTTATACDSYNWNGTVYDSSGVYTDTLTNSVGCDSIATLNLTINNSTTGSSSATTCDSYNWNGTTYTSSGVYTDTLTNSVGCDSIATLNLTINNSTSSTTIVDTCVTYDSTATFRYVRIFNDRSFMPTLMFGEFELYVAGVNVCRDTSHGYANLYMSAQQGSNTDSHKSNGVNGGTYYGPKTNAAPTNYWMIEFNNSYSLSEVQSAVLKTWTRYNWVSHRQALRGLQIQFLDQNLNQINEKIVVPNTQSSHYTVTQFNYKSGYTWNGTVYDSSAVYTDTLTNSVGCDSIVTLNLTINNNSTSTTTATACDSLIWNGTVYDSSGCVYRYTHKLSRL